MALLRSWKIKPNGSAIFRCDNQEEHRLSACDVRNIEAAFAHEFERDAPSIGSWRLTIEPKTVYSIGCVKFTIEQFEQFVMEYREGEWRKPIPWYENDTLHFNTNTVFEYRHSIGWKMILVKAHQSNWVLRVYSDSSRSLPHQQIGTYYIFPHTADMATMPAIALQAKIRRLDFPYRDYTPVEDNKE